MPLRALYSLVSSPEEIQERAFQIAVEQTIEFPYEAVHSRFIKEKITGKVLSIDQTGENQFTVEIFYDDLILTPSINQFLTVLYGNVSLLPDVQLIDFDISGATANLFLGPQFGITGIRNTLGIHDRALTCGVLKPMGLSIDELQRILLLYLESGIDIIKEDHGLNDFSFCHFEERVQKNQEIVQEYIHRTGRNVLYVPSVNSEPGTLQKQLEFCITRRIDAILLIPMIIGLPTFATIRKQYSFILLAHPAFAGVHRWSPSLIFGKIFRFFGADISIFPSYAGRFPVDQRETERIVTQLRRPHPKFAPAFPAPAGGLRLSHLHNAFSVYGIDAVYTIGGDLFLHSHPEKAAKQFVEIIYRLSDHSKESQAAQEESSHD